MHLHTPTRPFSLHLFEQICNFCRLCRVHHFWWCILVHFSKTNANCRFAPIFACITPVLVGNPFLGEIWSEAHPWPSIPSHIPTPPMLLHTVSLHEQDQDDPARCACIVRPCTLSAADMVTSPCLFRTAEPLPDGCQDTMQTHWLHTLILHRPRCLAWIIMMHSLLLHRHFTILHIPSIQKTLVPRTDETPKNKHDTFWHKFSIK